MRIALVQFNPVVGNVKGNVSRMASFTRDAHAHGADLVVFPELSVCGYPPMDLLDRPAFLDQVERGIVQLIAEIPEGVGVIVGAPVRNPNPVGKRLFNAALLLSHRGIEAHVYKRLLPTYDVFDEYRYFEPGPPQPVVIWNGVRIGLHVCEDMWNTPDAETPLLYAPDPVADLVRQGVDVLVNLSGSPFASGRSAVRQQLMRDSCLRHSVPFVLVNQSGANTELIFDGDSRVYGADGLPRCILPLFEEAMAVWDLAQPGSPLPDAPPSRIAQIHDALVLGIRDYMAKSPFFPKALLGLSGGIDSAVTAALAVEALGAERVVGVTMPSRYSSEGSVADSIALAEALGIPCHTLPIVEPVDAFSTMLQPLFEGTQVGVAEENIQSRVRGVALMALSNKFGYLLLTTGNKSEISVGYCTLYGDTNGGLGVIADVFKTDVYLLARYINERAGRDLIPQSTLTKPPSAELRPDQKDEDSLPPYDVLDAILVRYVERHLDATAIIAETGFDAELVRHLLNLVDRNEYKRRQLPPGLRVSRKAFGTGRRLPIVGSWERH